MAASGKTTSPTSLSSASSSFVVFSISAASTGPRNASWCLSIQWVYLIPSLISMLGDSFHPHLQYSERAAKGVQPWTRRMRSTSRPVILRPSRQWMKMGWLDGSKHTWAQIDGKKANNIHLEFNDAFGVPTFRQGIRAGRRAGSLSAMVLLMGQCIDRAPMEAMNFSRSSRGFSMVSEIIVFKCSLERCLTDNASIRKHSK